MEYAQQKLKEATETVQSSLSGTEAKANEEVAKGNTDAGIGTRADAATSYVGNKVDKKKHETKANVHGAEADST